MLYLRVWAKERSWTNRENICLEEPRKPTEISVRIAVIHVEVRNVYESEGWPLEQASFAVRLSNWDIYAVGQCGSCVQPYFFVFGVGWVLVEWRGPSGYPDYWRFFPLPRPWSLCHAVRPDLSGAHPTFSVIGTGRSFPGFQRPTQAPDYTHWPNIEIENESVQWRE